MQAYSESAAQVSAAADMRMAMDAMKMAVAEQKRVQSEMAKSAVMSNWESWQEQLRRAEQRVDEAVERVVSAARSQCRAGAA